MAKYLVTGAAGFIASRVCQDLLDAGHEVLGVDNMNDAYDVRLKEWRLPRLQSHPRFSFWQADINDAEAMKQVFCLQPEAVVNLAARAGVRQSLERPLIYVETNVAGTITLLDLCREFGVPRFILASTSSLYGAHNTLPFREDADTNRTLSPYAASKKAAEAMCYTYHYLYGLDITVVRYFTVYGPAGRPDMSLFRFVQWVAEGRRLILYGDGHQSRDFTYVDDIARGTIACLPLKGFTTVNLGSDKPRELGDALAVIEKLLRKRAVLEHRPMPRADVRATWADISRARELLGWEPRVSLDQGLERLVAWYLENRSWASRVVTGD